MSAQTIITDDDLILVTGASGYIATHIVKQLLDKGYRVRGTVRSLKNEKKVSPLRKLADKEKARFEIELVEADLMDEKSWLAAVSGCTYVIHTASPFPTNIPNDENELIKPAVDGTLNVFRACVQEGTKVKRVVLTSSTAAVTGEDFKEGYTFSEKDWPNIDILKPYMKSKTLAEKAAWDFLKEREKQGKDCFELAVINPGYVMGPLLHDSECTSMEIIKRFMSKAVPMVPEVFIGACDVRNVATAHVNALTVPEAKYNRHIITSTRECSTLLEWARTLHEEFAPKNYSVPTWRAPNFFLYCLSYIDKSVQQVIPMLGVRYSFDNSRMINVLGVNPIDLKTTLLDMTYSLIERGFIPKKF